MTQVVKFRVYADGEVVHEDDFQVAEVPLIVLEFIEDTAIQAGIDVMVEKGCLKPKKG